MIVEDIRDLKNTIGQHRVVMTSGGFDPLHVGHLRCIRESAIIARDSESKLVVVVNGDGFLSRKKGYSFMSLQERMEIIDGISGVDFVTTWDDGSQFVTGAVEILRPSIFTKGGDRTDRSNIPEFEVCDKIGCRVLTGIGGGKIQSSSDLVKRLNENR